MKTFAQGACVSVLSPRSCVRRRVLKLAGMAVGACAVAPLLRVVPAAAQPVTQTASAPLTVGVLVAGSSLLPSAATRWLAGLSSGLNDSLSDGAVELLVEHYGARPSAALAYAQTWVDQAHMRARAQPLRALLPLMDAHAAADLRQWSQQRGLPLVLSSLGANIARQTGDAETDSVHSLHYWKSLTALGTWAAHAIGPRALVASSFYDSGFDLPFAFQAGYEYAGGSVQATHVSHSPASNDLTTLMNAIRQAAPDVVFACYSGQAATEFLRAYADAGLSGRIPLLAGSFMVDDAALPTHGDAALGVYSCAPTQGDPFDLLGRQAALGLQRVMGLADATAPKMSRSRFNGVLQPVAFIPGFHSATPSPLQAPPAYRVCQVQAGSAQAGGAGLRNVVVEELAADGIVAACADVAAQLQGAPKTGWLYEYLCA